MDAVLKQIDGDSNKLKVKFKDVLLDLISQQAPQKENGSIEEMEKQLKDS